MTSYEEISMQFPPDSAIRNFEQDDDLTPMQCQQLRPKYLGPLFNLDFYRIVLDEAHAIKNPASQSKNPAPIQVSSWFSFHFGRANNRRSRGQSVYRAERQISMGSHWNSDPKSADRYE